MDCRSPNPICVLKVNINCCKGCQTKVEKSLLKIDGVYSITTDAEKRSVTVSGEAEPVKLIKMLAKMGKKAELLSYEKEPMNEQRGHEGQFKYNSQAIPEKCGQNDKQNFECCQTDRNHAARHKERHRGRHDHFCDDGEYNVRGRFPEEFDDHVCKDAYCTIHNSRFVLGKEVEGSGCRDAHCSIHNNRHIIRSCFPYPSGPLPIHHQSYDYSYSHSFPPTLHDRPQQHAYDPRYHRIMQPPAYGYHWQVPEQSLFDGFTQCFDDHNFRGCNVM